MMIFFETALSWLNKFTDTDSTLSSFNQRLVNQLETAYRDQDFEKMHLFTDLLVNASKKIEPGSSERAEISIILSRYAFNLLNFENAANLLREGIQQYYPVFEHNLGVARWLLGCVLWEIPKKQKTAIFAWQKSIDIFRPLSDTYDLGEATWYGQITQKMENALLEAIEIIELSETPAQAEKPERSPASGRTPTNITQDGNR